MTASPRRSATPPASGPGDSEMPLPLELAMGDGVLGVLPEHLGYLLRRAQIQVFQDFIDTMAPFDLRPGQYSVLCVLEASPGLKQTEVAQLLGIQRPNFVTLIDGLEKRGLARRDVAPGDRRSYALYLTETGLSLLRAAQDALAAHERRHADRLGGEDQRRALLGLLRRLTAE